MSWQSLTAQFDAEETGMLEAMPASALIPSAIASGPLVALRMLAELLLHGDDERLELLLADSGVRETWLQFTEDPFVDDRDYLYAIELRRRGLKYELA